MEIEEVPSSLALIPDGNRRWARAHNISFLRGYRIGVEKFIAFSEWCKDYGIKNITVWALSTENLKRPKYEINTLLNIYRSVAKDRDIINRLHNNETRFRLVGNTSLLPKDLLGSLRSLEAETRKYKERVINMLLAYGGTDDLLHAIKSFAADLARNKRMSINGEAGIRSYLLSSAVPDIDFVIRTSGEERLSGLLPLQAGYAELYFSRKLWPDFKKRDLRYALSDYSRRQRRFGR